MILGIDPGLKGALAFIDKNRNLFTYDMPVERRKNGKKYILGDQLAILIKQHRPIEAWIEDVYSSPQMGVVSAFTFGEGKGTLVGVLAALGVPTRFVVASVWKRQLGLTADKGRAKELARALYPKRKPLLSNEGKCEATLIATYGLLSHPNGSP